MMPVRYLPVMFAVLKVILHLASAQTMGLHRDELLYLALGRHPDWGYWSNPPLIGWLSFIMQHIFGDSILAVRLLPALCGGLLVWLVLRMVQEFGGGRWAVVLAAAGLFGSIAWLRAFSMLQPVPVDILCWTFVAYALLRWLNSQRVIYWWLAGAGLGVGMLNKYMLVFMGLAVLAALLCTPYRRVLRSAGPWIGLSISALLVLPNFLWQWTNGFPVVSHMQELRETQLEHVAPVQFLTDQLIFHGPSLLLWLAGLIWLMGARAAQPYRLFGYFFLAVLFLFLVLSGKSYYTLGAYPVLFAAGGVCWESVLRRIWQRLLLAAALVVLPLPIIPYGLPVMPPGQLAAYYRTFRLDGPLRWEDGRLHPLPQDFADMLGWPELGVLVDSALATAPDSNTCMVYAENYGQAGAAEYYALHKRGRCAVSFSDSYRLWAPGTLPPQTNTLIYINDELGEDVQRLFKNTQRIGEIRDPLAREFGTSVWLCTEPVRPFPDFWEERVKQIR